MLLILAALLLTPGAAVGNSTSYKAFSFLIQPQSYKVRLGEGVTYLCSAEGAVRYQWLYAKLGGVPSLLSGEQGSDLIFAQTNSSLNGFVICEVKDGQGDVYLSQPAKLEVIYFNKEFTVQPGAVTSIASGTHIHKILCTGPSSYPSATIKWYKSHSNGTKSEITELKDIFYNRDDGTLMLTNVGSGSGGVYVCSATNAVLNESRATNTTVIVTGTASPSSLSPKLAIYAGAGSAHIGQNLTLKCAAYGNPTPSIYWVFGDPATGETLCKIPTTRYQSSDQGRIITVLSLMQHESSYRFTCKAENSADIRTMGEPSSIQVMEALQITQPITHYHPLYKSRTFTIACPVKGQMLNTWYKNGLRITESGLYKFNSTANSVTISNTDIHGVYTCLSIYSSLPVFQIKLVNLHVCSPTLPVTVTLSSDNSSSTNQLTCTANGWPRPTVYWLKNDQQLAQERYSLSYPNETSVTSILNLTSSIYLDTDYSCTAVSQTEDWLSSQSVNTIRVATGVEMVRAFVTDWRVILGCAIICVIVLIVAIWLYLHGRKKRKAAFPVPRKLIKDKVELMKMGEEEPSTKFGKRQQKKLLKKDAKVELDNDLQRLKILRELAVDEDHDGMREFIMEMMKGGGGGGGGGGEGTTRI